MVHLPTLQLKGPKRLVWDWKKGDHQTFTADLDGRLSAIDDDQHNTTTSYNALCKAILAAAKGHIGLKAVGMSGESWRTIEISKAKAVKDTAKATFGIHSPDYKDLDAKLKRFVRDCNTDIWKRKVMKKKGTKEIWSILRSLTSSQPTDTARIISESGTNAFAKLYQSVSWLQIEKPDRGLKKRLNGRLRSDPINSKASGDFTLSEVKAGLKSLNPAKAPGPDMINQRFLQNLGPIAFNTLLRICNLVHDADTYGAESSQCLTRP